ncbi:MAG TPA: PH domain-containing protein [Rhodanobacteraceae bacterium]|nr:PH domain-containing protein [Rhodanobacteraceae bacterium]
MSNGIEDAPHDGAAQWRPLPARARALFVLGLAVPLAIVPAIPAFVLATAIDVDRPWAVAVVVVVIGAAIGAWLATRQYASTAWRHDHEGLALRRGRWWQRETRVPASRVQHLDVKRGPLQRRRGLATLVVHTAGTRHSAVTVPHLDETDAQRLREALSAQIGRDDD